MAAITNIHFINLFISIFYPKVDIHATSLTYASLKLLILLNSDYWEVTKLKRLLLSLTVFDARDI